ncbi:MAG TPA: 3-oxoacyl-ACP reductase FabG [Acetobacteraceae bacterium]|jgi:3-oxoacyl-[acyl-carrier protein] reductase|nr:3-oxoacyl-ACP reductase FabG [Acetobacteraceae bacterium]
MRRALVTGGSGALGAAICRRLGAAGRHVYVHANRGADRAERIAADIIATGGSASAVAFNVADAQATEAALAGVLADGAIEILINNAGIHDDAVMPGMRREQWNSVIDVSLNGFFNVTQPLLLPMIRQRWGRIINITSAAALAGNRGQVNYAAAKAGLHGATRALALELASRGVTVNAVAPGIIASPMANKAFDQEQISRLVPMKRAGTPEEVAELVQFLASESAGYISAQIISINGGML